MLHEVTRYVTDNLFSTISLKWSLKVLFKLASCAL